MIISSTAVFDLYCETTMYHIFQQVGKSRAWRLSVNSVGLWNEKWIRYALKAKRKANNRPKTEALSTVGLKDGGGGGWGVQFLVAIKVGRRRGDAYLLEGLSSVHWVPVGGVIRGIGKG